MANFELDMKAHANVPNARSKEALSPENSSKKNSENHTTESVNQQEDLKKRFESLREIARSLDPEKIEAFLDVQKMRLGETLQSIEQTGKLIALESKKEKEGHPLVFDRDLSKEDLSQVPDATTRALRVREAVGEARRGLQSGVLSSPQNELQYTGIEPIEALFALRIGSSLNQMGLPTQWIGGQAESTKDLSEKVLTGQISIKGVGQSETILILSEVSSALKILNERAREKGLPEMKIPEIEALEGKIKEADQSLREEGKRVHDLFSTKDEPLSLKEGRDISFINKGYEAFSETADIKSSKVNKDLVLPNPEIVLQYQEAAEQNAPLKMRLSPQSIETLDESIRVLDSMHLGLSPAGLRVSSELLRELGIPEDEFKALQGDLISTIGTGKEAHLGSIIRNDPLHGAMERLQGAMTLGNEERKEALQVLIEDVRKGMRTAGLRGEFAQAEDESLFNRSMEIAGVIINPVDGAMHMLGAHQGSAHTIELREKKWMAQIEHSAKEVDKLLTEAKEALNSDRHSDGLKALKGAIEHAANSDELSRVYAHAAGDRSVSSGFTAAAFIQMGASLGFRMVGSSTMRQFVGVRAGAGAVPKTGAGTGATTAVRSQPKLSGEQFNDLFQVKPGSIRPNTGNPAGGGGGMPLRGPITRGTPQGGGGLDFGGSGGRGFSGGGVGGGGTATLSRSVISPAMSTETNQALQSIRAVVQRSAVSPSITSGAARTGLEGVALSTSTDISLLLGGELAGGLAPLTMPRVTEFETPLPFTISTEKTEIDEAREKIIEEVRRELDGNLDLFESEREQIIEDLRELLGSEVRPDEMREFLRSLELDNKLSRIISEVENIKTSERQSREFSEKEASMSEDRGNRNVQDSDNQEAINAIENTNMSQGNKEYLKPATLAFMDEEVARKVFKDYPQLAKQILGLAELANKEGVTPEELRGELKKISTSLRDMKKADAQLQSVLSAFIGGTSAVTPSMVRDNTASQFIKSAVNGFIETESLIIENQKLIQATLQIIIARSLKINEGQRGVIFALPRDQINENSLLVEALKQLGLESDKDSVAKILKLFSYSKMEAEFAMHQKAQEILASANNENPGKFAAVPTIYLRTQIAINSETLIEKLTRDGITLNSSNEIGVLMMEQIPGQTIADALYRRVLREHNKSLDNPAVQDEIKNMERQGLYVGPQFDKVNIPENASTLQLRSLVAKAMGFKSPPVGADEAQISATYRENGNKMFSFLRNQDVRIKSSVITRLNNSIRELNANGLYHNDAHEGNFMIVGDDDAIFETRLDGTKSTSEPDLYIIDFGESTETPIEGVESDYSTVNQLRAINNRR